MTKADLVSKIVKETGVDKFTATTVVESMMKNIKECLVSGENVYLRGFGTLGLRSRAEKKARNIGRNSTIVIPPHYVPYFKPSKELVTEVAKISMDDSNVKTI